MKNKSIRYFIEITETIEGVCQYGQQIDVTEEQFKKLSEGEPFDLKGHKVAFRLFVRDRNLSKKEINYDFHRRNIQ